MSARAAAAQTIFFIKASYFYGKRRFLSFFDGPQESHPSRRPFFSPDNGDRTSAGYLDSFFTFS
jgi:hypothetical protein